MNDLLPEHIDDIDMNGMNDDNDLTRVRLRALITKLTHWRILMEQEHGEPPKFEIPLSIRRKCMELEVAIAPELEDPENVINEPDDLTPSRCYQEYPMYIELKWQLILMKTDDVRVQRLIALMKKSKVPRDKFCKTMGEFVSQPTLNINLVARPLSNFTPEEVKSSLKYHFVEETTLESEIAIKSITHVLMKVH